MIENHIKQKILQYSVSLDRFGMDDLTWEKEAAGTLITSLMKDDIGILGGSVYKIDSNNLIPMYDNWFCNRNAKEKNKEFYLRSKIKAFEYIDKYPVYPGEIILFSLVFTDDI